MSHLQHSVFIATVPLALEIEGLVGTPCGEYFIGTFSADRSASPRADGCILSLESGEIVQRDADSGSVAGENWARIERTELTVVGSEMNTQAIYYIIDRDRLVVFNDLFLAASLLSALGCEVAYDPEEFGKELTFFGHVRRLTAGQRLSVRNLDRNLTLSSSQFAQILADSEPLYPDIEQAQAEMLAAMEAAVRHSIGDCSRPCVALSGGVDSGTVAALAAAHVPLSVYSLATTWGEEFAEATQTAEFLGQKVERVYVSAEEIVEEIPHVIRFFHFSNVESVEIALVAHCLYRKLQARNPDWRVFLTGYGSDLMNAGGVYSYDSPAQLHGNIRAELLRTQRSNEFSGLAALSCQVRVRHPFWDAAVIRSALRTRPEFKLRDGLDKYYLREMMRGKLPMATRHRAKLGAHRGTGLAQHLATVFGGPATYARRLQDLHREIIGRGHYQGVSAV